MSLDELVEMDGGGGIMSPTGMGACGGASVYPCSRERIARAKRRLLEGYYDHPDVLLVLAEILIKSGTVWGRD